MAEFESIWSDLQGVAFEQGYLNAGVSGPATCVPVIPASRY